MVGELERATAVQGWGGRQSDCFCEVPNLSNKPRTSVGGLWGGTGTSLECRWRKPNRRLGGEFEEVQLVDEPKSFIVRRCTSDLGVRLA